MLVQGKKYVNAVALCLTEDDIRHEEAERDLDTTFQTAVNPKQFQRKWDMAVIICNCQPNIQQFSSRDVMPQLYIYQLPYQYTVVVNSLQVVYIWRLGSQMVVGHWWPSAGSSNRLRFYECWMGLAVSNATWPMGITQSQKTAIMATDLTPSHHEYH